MFERYTEPARRVLFFSRYEATQRGSASIEPEHVLLGILRDPQGPTGQWLELVSADRIDQQLNLPRATDGPTPSSVEIPFTASCKRVLQFAAEEADRLRHGYIGIEHLLMGIVREGQCTASTVLVRGGLHLDYLRQEGRR